MSWSASVTMWTSLVVLLAALHLATNIATCALQNSEAFDPFPDEILSESETPLVRRRHDIVNNFQENPRSDDDFEDHGPLPHENVKYFVHKKRHFVTRDASQHEKETADRKALAQACLEALERLLGYFSEHMDQIIADGFLGVALAQGQMNSILALEDDSIKTVRPLLERLQSSCEHILMGVQPMINKGLVLHVKGVQTLLKPEFWLGSPAGSRGVLTGGRESPWPLPPMAGTPDETTSDRCLSELLAGECEVTDECWTKETQGRALGYSLTHRLIFIYTAKQRECDSELLARVGTTSDQLIASSCADILSEAREIAAREYPELLRDLFLEQVALCGTQGYVEFSDLSWVKSILAWQHSDGCYGMDVFRRTKRSEQSMGDAGCLVHYTAVAAGALATSARILLSPH